MSGDRPVEVPRQQEWHTVTFEETGDAELTLMNGLVEVMRSCNMPRRTQTRVAEWFRMRYGWNPDEAEG